MKIKTPLNQENYTQEHMKMLRILWWNPDLLKNGLKLNYVWIRSMEYVFDPTTQEKADLIFQDKFNARNPEEGTVCFVVELKSDLGDHEIVGQLKKAVYRLDKRGKAIGHWDKTVGIAIARKFTKSGIELLWAEGFRAFTWNESSNGIELNEHIKPEENQYNVAKGLLKKLKNNRKK